ncbi:hypothetical protein Ddye_005163 [Dipteronia dyeriana]|uniref:Uncharacterized protein n=1 Tax=Dipteronia dyeriana TaxID=168575 RepID=A0AAE0CPC9_9ROSI|nr:hypothetical protein Ddye_005163 [Dipteronia dyeriana]
MDAEQEAILAQHGNFQRAITQYLNQQNNPVTREDSIPSHIVINRDQKRVDHRLFYVPPRCPANTTDKYIKIEESTTIESLKRFCRAVVEKFASEYLRSPNSIVVA